METVTFIATDPLNKGDVVLGVEQHGFVMPDLRVQLNPGGREAVFVPHDAAGAYLPLVILPDTRLTEAGLIEAARLFLRHSGEHGRIETPEIVVKIWRETGLPDMPVYEEDTLAVGKYNHPARGWVGCAPDGVEQAARLLQFDRVTVL